jgi:protein required for attachment to host cells
MKTWAMVASSARGRLFEQADRRAPFEEVLDLVNPKGPLPRQALETDKPGRAFDSRGGHRHAMEPRVDAKEEAATRFARQLADALQTGLNEHRFEALYLVAPPHFLGLLRRQLSPGLQRSVAGELGKDLTRADAAGITGQVRAMA